jgi:microcin C transport system permease protein
VVTSVLLSLGVAVPGFLLAVFLVLLFAQGGVWPWFPLRGLGDGFWDYAWHLVLPMVAMTAGGFASLTMLTKNAFLEELEKLYVTAARAKGASERRVMFCHVLRNAILPLAAGFPAAFVAIFFSSALFVEIVFSLNGLGLLGYEAVLTRDYPVMFGTLYVYTLVGLAMRVVGDLLLLLIDPRVGFEGR